MDLFVDAVLGSCVDELGTTRFHLWFGAVEQQHVTFFLSASTRVQCKRCKATITKATWKHPRVADIHAASSVALPRSRVSCVVELFCGLIC